jgi:hypothetical protein
MIGDERRVDRPLRNRGFESFASIRRFPYFARMTDASRPRMVPGQRLDVAKLTGGGRAQNMVSIVIIGGGFKRWHACAPLDRAKTESSRSPVRRSSSRSRKCCKPWSAASPADVPRNNRAEGDSLIYGPIEPGGMHLSVINSVPSIRFGVGRVLESASHKAVEMGVSERRTGHVVAGQRLPSLRQRHLDGED